MLIIGETQTSLLIDKVFIYTKYIFCGGEVSRDVVGTRVLSVGEM